MFYLPFLIFTHIRLKWPQKKYFTKNKFIRPYTGKVIEIVSFIHKILWLVAPIKMYWKYIKKPNKPW